MKKLTLPSRYTQRDDLVNSIYTYQHDGQQKGHDLTQADIEDIVSLYDEYDANGGQPAENLKGPNLAASLIEAVRKAYGKTYERGVLHHIRDSLTLNIETCPVCGIDPADELDHFLPKAEFKILSIYVRNLIPICNKCNKDKRVLGGNIPASQFVHAYLEDIPEVRFLTTDTSLQDSKLSVNIGVDPTAAISPALSQRLSYQLSHLKLNLRYRREINIYLGGFSPHWHPLYQSKGPDSISEWLTRQSAYEANRYHLNDWRTLVFQGLAVHQGFCDGGFREAFPVPENLWVNS